MTRMALDNLDCMKAAARELGHGEVTEIIFRATILHEEWEMDNHGWVVRMNDGTLRGYTTSHGRLHQWKYDAIRDKINETAESLVSLGKALDLLNS
jgi:acylphosphatase